MKLKQRNQGFTIIEVVIVLSIASLIMLIVFLAVPALQRSQKNSARKSEAGRYAAAVTDYTSNNNGSLPSDATTCGNYLSNVGNASQFKFASCDTSAGTALPAAPNGKFYLVTSLASTSTASTASLSSNTMILVTGATCDPASPAVVGKVVTGSASQTALLYSYETGSGWSWNCINPQ